MTEQQQKLPKQQQKHSTVCVFITGNNFLIFLTNVEIIEKPSNHTNGNQNASVIIDKTVWGAWPSSMATVGFLNAVLQN